MSHLFPRSSGAIALYPTTTTNPYVGMIRRGLEVRGVPVTDWSQWRLGNPTPRVLHLNWLEILSHGRITRRSLLATHVTYLRLEAHMQRVRKAGGLTVWTAHNARPHEMGGDRRARLVQQWIDRIVGQVDAVISLSNAAIPIIREAHPTLVAPITVIPHQSYRGEYPAGDRDGARVRLGIPATARVCGMIGLMRPYKEIERGLDLFEDLEAPDTWLLILGDCFDPDLARRLAARAAGNPRVIFKVGHLDQQAFADAYAACDAVLAMQRVMLNSGSVMAALSLDRPVIAEPVGSLPELAETVGDDWLRLRKPLNAEALRHALAMPLPAGSPDLAAFDINTIVEQHLKVYGFNAATQRNPSREHANAAIED